VINAVSHQGNDYANKQNQKPIPVFIFPLIHLMEQYRNCQKHTDNWIRMDQEIKGTWGKIQMAG
jgi:hypothetical protein